jgi:hypothetical protein
MTFGHPVPGKQKLMSTLQSVDQVNRLYQLDLVVFSSRTVSQLALITIRLRNYLPNKNQKYCGEANELYFY